MSYNITIISNVKEKWEQTLNEEIPFNTIEKALTNLSKMEESAYQKYLQFKLLHSRRITNEKLYTINISDSNLCSICGSNIETIKHAFIDCNSIMESSRTLGENDFNTHSKIYKHRQNFWKTNQYHFIRQNNNMCKDSDI